MEVEVRVLIAPDSFTGTLTSSQAAETIAQGWAQAAPWDELDIAAISDGGPGFLDAIAMDAGIELLPIFVKSLTQQLIPTAIGLTKVDQRTAYIESATIIGSALVAIFPKTPEKYSSFGIGEAILAAKEQGAKKVIVGLGGTGLVDGGAGMLAALGARPAELLTQGGLALSDLTFVDLEPVISAVAGMEFQIATDVLVPLLGERGAAIGFGAQKGADRETQIQLEKSLQHFSFVLGKRSDGKDPALILGAGAAGGLCMARPSRKLPKRHCSLGSRSWCSLAELRWVGESGQHKESWGLMQRLMMVRYQRIRKCPLVHWLQGLREHILQIHGRLSP
jgi:glycerate kinase